MVRAAAAVLAVWQVSLAEVSADQKLVSRIQAKFARSKLREDRFIVKLDGDQVILEGRTPVPQHKGVATRLARSAGAKNVINRIQIAGRPVPGAPPTGELRRAIVKRE